MVSEILEHIDYYLVILFLYTIGMVVSYFRSATHYIKKYKTDPIYKVKLNSNLTTYFTVLLTIITLIIFIKTSIATILFLIFILDGINKIIEYYVNRYLYFFDNGLFMHGKFIEYSSITKVKILDTKRKTLFKLQIEFDDTTLSENINYLYKDEVANYLSRNLSNVFNYLNT
ncbi:MAG: hypothetical protein E6423_00120 [Clostridium sp.]|uniref:hypothetical protein n=1 Tax=Clostridium TaxID=1485 RepID=UPI000C079DAF|nr:MULTISPECIES: hypothetical protein [Clostridium]MDU1937713.1 hypothetical protein [Clostridium sp.]MDU2046222.1 hypothetical protein [Clostridium sp.]MDU3411809.1 hypothetical protein [Clostridium sp.]MDU4787018.1 hypothetical protein [Clostridium sp.]MDU6807167.1 hypothetical protein [Clostridium sp.]